MTDGSSAADVCVVGSGAAGTALALRLRDQGRSVLLLESGGARRSRDALVTERGRHDDAADRRGDAGERFARRHHELWWGGAAMLEEIGLSPPRRGSASRGGQSGAGSCCPYYARGCQHPRGPRPHAVPTRSALRGMGRGFLVQHDGPRHRHAVLASPPAPVPPPARPRRPRGPRDRGAPVRERHPHRPRAVGRGGRPSRGRHDQRPAAARPAEGRRPRLRGHRERPPPPGVARSRGPGLEPGRGRALYMDHAKGTVGEVAIDLDVHRLIHPAYWDSRPGRFRLGVRLSDDRQRREQLLDAYVRFHPILQSDGRGAAALREIRRHHAAALRHPQTVGRLVTGLPEIGALGLFKALNIGRIRAVEVHSFLEQAPRRENRVVLADRKDPFGHPLAGLEWTVGRPRPPDDPGAPRDARRGPAAAGVRVREQSRCSRGTTTRGRSRATRPTTWGPRGWATTPRPPWSIATVASTGSTTSTWPAAPSSRRAGTPTRRSRSSRSPFVSATTSRRPDGAIRSGAPAAPSSGCRTKGTLDGSSTRRFRSSSLADGGNGSATEHGAQPTRAATHRQGGRQWRRRTSTWGSSAAGRPAAAWPRTSRKAGVDCVVFERELFPRPHVGESLVPSSTRVFKDLDFLPVMEEHKFPRKYGAVWTRARHENSQAYSARLGGPRRPDSAAPTSASRSATSRASTRTTRTTSIAASSTSCSSSTRTSSAPQVYEGVTVEGRATSDGPDVVGSASTWAARDAGRTRADASSTRAAARRCSATSSRAHQGTTRSSTSTRSTPGSTTSTAATAAPQDEPATTSTSTSCRSRTVGLADPDHATRSPASAS